VRQAILADLGLADPPAAAPAAPALRPVVITRSGTLAPGERVSIGFSLLGPGRRATFTVGGAAPARLEVACGGRVARRTRAAGGAATTLDVRNLGPGACTARLTGTGSAPLAFSARLRLTVAA
jgi:hypothetical protein